MLESRQFVLPLLSQRATEDPRNKRDFTLNQFNMIVAPGGGSIDLSTLHFYTFNPAFINGLPSVLRTRSAEWLQVQLLRRLTVAFGYLPSWNSARLRIYIGSRCEQPESSRFSYFQRSPSSGQGQMIRAVLLRLIRSARILDLYPLIPMLRLSPPGKAITGGELSPHY